LGSVAALPGNGHDLAWLHGALKPKSYLNRLV
jgi:hypothetical protein